MSDMSKQSRKKARQRKMKHKQTWKLLCPSCGRGDDGSVGALLTQVADALNVCADSGLKVALRHGVVMAAGKGIGGGYVLPTSDGHWTARDQRYDRFVQVPSLLDDDD